MRSPRITHLSNRYRVRSVKTDIDSIMPALTGNGVHDQLQRYLRQQNTIDSKWMVERRLCAVIDGVRVSGRFDAMYDKKILYDIKVTKAYKILKGDTTEWEEQLNAYDYMLWKDGIDVSSLNICSVISDWNKGETWMTEYPDTRLSIIPIQRWDRARQKLWLETRVGLWKSSKDLADDDLPLCTPKERWANATIYKLFRTPGLKRANKTFPTRARAVSYMNACISKDSAKWGKAVIREETGEPWRRCGFCDAQAFCNQFKNKLEP